jgi:hypothetical protein
MAVRKEGDTDASTQIAAISVKLGDSTMSISERLQQVHRSSTDAKDEASQMSREALMNYLVLTGGAATLLSKTPLSDYVPPLTSVNVSNVAGPGYRCYLGGAEVIRSYPVSTLAGGTAINITFSSFSGRMDYAVITDAQAVSGAQEIADYMSAAMDDLEAALHPEKPRAKKRAAPTGKKAAPTGKKAAPTGKKAASTRKKAAPTRKKAASTRKKAAPTRKKASPAKTSRRKKPA